MLDDVLNEAPAVAAEGAVEGADDAGGDGGVQAVGVADGDDELPHAERAGGTDRGEGEVAGGEADEGEIGGGVVADDFGVEAVPLGGGGGEAGAGVDDVAVGEGVAVRADEDAGAASPCPPSSPAS